MQAKVVMDVVEWDQYKKLFTVGSQMHYPMIPPSFPVLVVSEVRNDGYGSRASITAYHSFIEAQDMKRFLGLP